MTTRLPARSKSPRNGAQRPPSTPNQARNVVKQTSAPESTRRLFGTDGVRGVANVHPMTAEMALQLGRALAYIVRSGPHRHRIVVGKDTRLSGYMLEQAIASGICSMGVDVMLSGPLPTPGIAFLTESMRADAGVVISASHNPYQDNGIKFFSRDGFKLADELEAEIERLVLGESGTEDFHALRPTATRIGKAKRIDDAALDFYEAILRHGKLAERGYQALEDADVEIEKLRLYLRLAQEMKLLSFEQYEFATRQVAEIGKLLGAWMQKDKAPAMSTR